MKKVLFYTLLLGILFPAVKLLAQTDSTKNHLLNELTIQSSPGKDQLSFYQSSKLTTTEEILARMEGVNLIRRGAYGMEPTLRNYSANQITLSIDGMRIYGACPDKMDPVSIYVEPINLQNISAAHGASGNFVGGGIGGNINLSFKTPNTLCHTQWLAQVVQSYSTNNNGIATSFAVEKSGPKDAFRISGTYRKAGDYFAPSGRIRYSAYEKLNMAVSYQVQIDSNYQVRFSYLGDWGRNMGYPALPMDVGLANAHIGSISYLYADGKGIIKSNELKLYANDIYHEMDDTQREFVPMHMDMPSWSRTFGAYNEISLAKNRHQLKVRADVHQNFMRADMTMYPNNTDPIMFMQTLPNSILQNAGLAFQYAYDVTLNYQMRFHGRIDYVKHYAEPSIGAESWVGFNHDILQAKINHLKSFAWIHSLQHKGGFRQNISMGYAERNPSSNERYGFYLFIPMDAFDYLGNPDLHKEKSWQLEYNVRQEKRNYSWSVQPFYHLTQ
ncbi:MAG: TonB-dependent receptor, partial [Bacteroidia bacterium]|nr:TonB-dependent receptor [Bacteroidia bacterium]